MDRSVPWRSPSVHSISSPLAASFSGWFIITPLADEKTLQLRSASRHAA
ncbi:unannotated protein [freshwater metagenome]|uniref:Unannotated protein n=1 Tax=freshwater metagenome TaxID=449393 RepID=A0A6J7FXP6_9ZZZZ